MSFFKMPPPHNTTLVPPSLTVCLALRPFVGGTEGGCKIDIANPPFQASPLPTFSNSTLGIWSPSAFIAREKRIWGVGRGSLAICWKMGWGLYPSPPPSQGTWDRPQPRNMSRHVAAGQRSAQGGRKGGLRREPPTLLQSPAIGWAG